jgi:hypothetical protein
MPRAALPISCDHVLMEAIMASNITQLLIGAGLGIAISVAGISVVGSAVAQSPAEHAIAQEVLTNRHESPSSETEFRFGDHQQLRKLFLGN